MRLELKPRTVVAVVIVIAIVVTGYFYMKKTAPERAYKTELHKLRLVEEHQRLEIEVVKQRATLNAMKKAAEDAMPTYNLTPAQAEEKKKVLEQANQPPPENK